MINSCTTILYENHDDLAMAMNIIVDVRDRKIILVDAVNNQSVWAA